MTFRRSVRMTRRCNTGRHCPGGHGLNFSKGTRASGLLGTHTTLRTNITSADFLFGLRLHSFAFQKIVTVKGLLSKDAPTERNMTNLPSKFTETEELRPAKFIP